MNHAVESSPRGSVVRDRAHRALQELGLPLEVLEYIGLTEDDADRLAALVVEQRPARVLEVGSFVGISTAVLAVAAGPASRVTTIDPDFPVSVDAAQFGYAGSESSAHFRDRMLARLGVRERVNFLHGYYSRVSQPVALAVPAKHGVDVLSVPVVGASAGGPFDLAFIDGDHTAISVAADMALCVDHLSPTGIMVLHDFEGDHAPEVTGGVDRFLSAHEGWQLSVHGNLGVVRRVARASVI